VCGQVVGQLKTLYASANDVDLYVGAMAERPAEGALVGPTFRCLLAKQLGDTRRSDRYFYDLQQQPGSFSSGNHSHILRDNLVITPAKTIQLRLPKNKRVRVKNLVFFS